MKITTEIPDNLPEGGFVMPLFMYSSERRKLEKMSFLAGIEPGEFLISLIHEKYEEMRGKEVRQYEHSGVHSEIHKGSRKFDADDSERTGADRNSCPDGKTGAEG